MRDESTGSASTVESSSVLDRSIAAPDQHAMNRAAQARAWGRQAKTIVTHAALIALSVVFAFPLYWLIKTSLVSNGEAMKIPPSYWPHAFLWSNYSKAFTYGSEAPRHISLPLPG